MRKFCIYQLYHCKKITNFKMNLSPRNFLIVKLIFKKLFINVWLTDGNFRYVDRSGWMVCIIEIILYRKIRVWARGLNVIVKFYRPGECSPQKDYTKSTDRNLSHDSDYEFRSGCQSPLPTTVLLRSTFTRTIKLHY